MNFLATLKKTLKENEKDLILGAIIVLVALISFGLGRLSKIREQKTSITIENGISVTNEALREEKSQVGQSEASGNLASVGLITTPKEVRLPSAPSTGGKIVASKSGTKYHYPWCAGAKSINEANKIYFNSESAARQAGYTPASNCKGLK